MASLEERVKSLESELAKRRIGGIEIEWEAAKEDGSGRERRVEVFRSPLEMPDEFAQMQSREGYVDVHRCAIAGEALEDLRASGVIVGLGNHTTKFDGLAATFTGYDARAVVALLYAVKRAVAYYGRFGGLV